MARKGLTNIGGITMKLNEQRRIYKINSTFLKANKWNLDLPLDVAMTDYNDLIITINDSQLLRWIDELNGTKDITAEIKTIKELIRKEKSKTKTTRTAAKIKALYQRLFDLQFCPDYVCVVMDKIKDYDKTNKGFSINGIKFKRLLGTTGGIKAKTIIYINEKLYSPIMAKINNGRNPNVPIVPAKLNAYQALVATGSIPIPQPEGVIVVNDCITRFRNNIIQISDESEGEPTLTYLTNQEIEHNNSDGCGLMLPSYSAKVNKYLNGIDEPISGINTRWAFEKGMLFTFDFIDFAEKIAGTYEIVDAWGNVQDVRNAEVILTVSMLKLWDSYNNFNEYYDNCIANGYELACAKSAPLALENIRSTNYQFLQSYELTDEQINELCLPMIEETKEVLGGDYRKSILYLAGIKLNEHSIKNMPDDYLKALMINPQLITDPYIKHQIASNIQKKIDDAKIGKIDIQANFAIVGGDLFALAQSMFNLPITGLLQAGECYHYYWRNSPEIALFRAPMTCHNNIKRMKINTSADCLYWFKYLTTVNIVNAWDCTCEMLNGMDFDSDITYATNNKILLQTLKDCLPIICMQKKAEKKIPTEDDLIKSNILAFNDEIGTITNRATAMFDVQSSFAADSDEYKTLAYRIMCCQLLQQNSIDKAKGIISKPMPESWHKVNENNTTLERAIVADRKPYFMIYRYPQLKKEYNNYVKNNNSNAMRKYKMSIAELQALPNPSNDIIEFLKYYNYGLPVTVNNCTVNRICRLFETEFSAIKTTDSYFDYDVYKSGVGYSTQTYKKILALYKEYNNQIKMFMTRTKEIDIDNVDANVEKEEMKRRFKEKCDILCPDDAVLCDILIDICYNSNHSKSFVWAMCGNQIIKNLYNKFGYTLTIPMADAEGDFRYMGKKYKMVKTEVMHNE